MTISRRRPFRGAGKTSTKSFVGLLLAIAVTGVTAAPNGAQAETRRFTVDSLSLAAAKLHSCRSHRHRSCLAVKAHLSRLEQTARRAPATTADGTAIAWTSAARVDSYVLARKSQGRPYQYSVVKATHVTPQAAPGRAVDFWVRADVSDSAWSHVITITYPSHTEVTTTTTEPFVKGIDEELDGWGEAAVPQIAEEVHNLGANWIRVDLEWREVMPSPGVYDWSPFDRVVENARIHGLHLLPILDYAPSWTEPSNATAYAEFVAAAVARYGPGTSANLQWFELWNEPYFSYAWSGKTPEPDAYARDVAAASQAARRVSPTVKLLLEADYSEAEQVGTTPMETSWIEDMFIAEPDLGSMVNAVAVHPYGDDPSQPLATNSKWTDAAGNWAFQRIDTIHEEFLAHGVSLPFWITEEGWSTREVTEASQAKYYTDLAAQVAKRPWITALFPYTLRENEAKPVNNQSQFGLLRYWSWEPKPAYYALRGAFSALS